MTTTKPKRKRFSWKEPPFEGSLTFGGLEDAIHKAIFADKIDDALDIVEHLVRALKKISRSGQMNSDPEKRGAVAELLITPR